MPVDHDVAPFGLGWTRRIGGPELTAGLPPVEAYARRLAVGLMGLNAVFYTIATTALLATGAPPIMPLSTAIGGVSSLALLVVFAALGTHFALIVHVWLAVVALTTWVNVIPEGGLADSGQPMWGIANIVFAAALLGWRHAAAWTAIQLLLVIAAGALGTLPTEIPEEVRASTAIPNHVLFAACMGAVMAWTVELRGLVLRQVERERARSDALLGDALPPSVAGRLRAGEVIADLHDDVGVLFADMVGFTRLASELPPTQLVRFLSEIFEEIDRCVAAEGLCKIKTIGDCYMVASNVPRPREDHLDALARVALAVRERVSGRALHGHRIDVRVGMHVGPAVAGVIGEQRRLYDLWGDTVNVASRMESTGEPGRIQVTDRVRRRLGERFRFVDRGAVEAKGKGPIQAWFLEGPASGAEAT